VRQCVPSSSGSTGRRHNLLPAGAFWLHAISRLLHDWIHSVNGWMDARFALSICFCTHILRRFNFAALCCARATYVSVCLSLLMRAREISSSLFHHTVGLVIFYSFLLRDLQDICSSETHVSWFSSWCILDTESYDKLLNFLNVESYDTWWQWMTREAYG